jgi:hypothetical protein
MACTPAFQHASSGACRELLPAACHQLSPSVERPRPVPRSRSGNRLIASAHRGDCIAGRSGSTVSWPWPEAWRNRRAVLACLLSTDPWRSAASMGETMMIEIGPCAAPHRTDHM